MVQFLNLQQPKNKQNHKGDKLRGEEKNMKKTLTQIVLGTALALSSVGCNNSNYPLVFDGVIDNEKIHYEVGRFREADILTVETTDGRVVKYFDHWRPKRGEIDSIKVSHKGKETQYKDGAISREVIKIGQEQFDKYTQKIIDYKKKKAFKDINGTNDFPPID